MAEKTLILKVDLSCTLCCKKMNKIFSKYQDKWNIKKIKWNEKNDEIILVGPFDPEKLKKRLCCKACRTIKDFIIPPPPKPEPPKPAPEPPKPEPPKPAPEPPKPEPPKPAPEPPKPEPPKPAPEPPKPEPPKPAPEPPKPEPPKPAPEPPKPAPEPPKPAPPPPATLWVTGQICTCGSCHDKKTPCSCDCSHDHRPCCWCGDGYHCGYGYGCGYPPPPVYGRPTCQFYCEDDTSGLCSVM